MKNYLKNLDPIATRKSSEMFLELITSLPNLIGGSADLAGSNNTKTKKHEIDHFIESSTAAELSELTMDLDEYLVGGSDNEHKQLREGYGHIPKPQARKIKTYLYGILEDAWRYSRDRRPGRRKKQSK